MENSLIKYIVYITTNIINGKIYIGVHKTDKPYNFDGYLGGGAWVNDNSSYNKGKVPLHAAILKYGVNSFKRATLKVFDNLLDALDLERWLVTQEFISQPNNYNATVGGGMPPDPSKKVYQFTLEGHLIKEWKSGKSITTHYECSVSMTDIIRDKRNFAGSFWSFENIIDITEYKRVTSHGYIDLYDTFGNYLTSYKSTNVASLKLDIDFRKLNMAIFRKKKCEGYYFLHSGEDIYEVIKPKKTINKHPVCNYNIDGEFISEFATMALAGRELGILPVSIKHAITRGTLYNNQYWSCYKGSNYFDLSNPTSFTKIQKIGQYDLNGNLIKIWDDYEACRKEFPYCLDTCRGKLKTTRGYIFKYEN